MKGRDGEGGQTGFVATREWLQTFRAQWTPDLIEKAHRYAGAQARKVAHVRAVPPTYAEELVQDIIGDTVTGVIAWDPDRVSLLKHVLDAIRSRTRHAYVQAIRFRPVRLQTNLSEAEHALAARRANADAVAVTAHAALEHLGALAQDDPEVTLVLDAYQQLVTKRFDVLRYTKLTAKQYDAARHRLKRLIDQLPASLRLAQERE